MGRRTVRGSVKGGGGGEREEEKGERCVVGERDGDGGVFFIVKRSVNDVDGRTWRTSLLSKMSRSD